MHQRITSGNLKGAAEAVHIKSTVIWPLMPPLGFKD